MKCPYCAEEIKDEAIVCKHCHQNIAVFRGLLERLEDIDRRLREIEAGEQPARPVLPPAPEPPRAYDKASSVAAIIQARIPPLSPAAALLLAFGSLLATHFLIIVYYDLPLLWLRIASLLLPFMFGFLYRREPTEYLLGDLLVGFVLAAAAILAMAAVVAEVDGVPLLPDDAQGWREFAEYGVSIAFAFFTGAVVRQTIIAMSVPGEKTSRLVYLASRYLAAKISGVAPHDPNDPRMDKHLKRLGLAQRAISIAIAGASALTSIWSGVGRFL